MKGKTGNSRESVLSLTASQKFQRFALRALCKVSLNLGANVALHHFTKARRRSLYKQESLPPGKISLFLSYRKGHLSTYSWGEGKRTVYLVHGWESHVGRMSGFIQPLLDRGFRVVAFDMPGHGYSSQQQTYLNDFSAALGSVIKHYGEPYGIIAHSFGATATAVLLEKQRNLRPKRLCLIAPMFSIQDHINIFNTIAGLSQNVIDKMIAQLKRRFSDEVCEYDMTQLIGKIDLGGFLVHDEHDSLIPFECGQQLSQSWQRASFLKTQNLGHRKILKNSEVIDSIITYVAVLS